MLIFTFPFVGNKVLLWRWGRQRAPYWGCLSIYYHFSSCLTICRSTNKFKVAGRDDSCSLKEDVARFFLPLLFTSLKYNIADTHWTKVFRKPKFLSSMSHFFTPRIWVDLSLFRLTVPLQMMVDDEMVQGWSSSKTVINIRRKDALELLYASRYVREYQVRND